VTRDRHAEEPEHNAVETSKHGGVRPIREMMPFCGLAEESEGVARTFNRAPRNGSATIVCDGRGGYRTSLGGWAGAPCGIEGCVRLHEESHAADWMRRHPDGCKNDDDSPKPDGSTIPINQGAGYAAFLRPSECTAYGVEEVCITPLIAGADDVCKPKLEAHLLDTQGQKAGFC